MEWVETTGRSVEAAVDAALDMLGVHEEDLEYEVLTQPKSGFLGLGSAEARIRARVKPISREKPDDRRRRRGGKSRGESGGRRERRPQGSSPRSSKSQSSKREGGGRGARTARDAPRSERTKEDTMDDGPQVSVEDQASTASDFASGLVDAFGAKGDVTTEIDDDTILLRIDGNDLGLLVGPKGATLHAVEELVRAVVQPESAGRSGLLGVDLT